jgi:hypothetical protein
MKRILEKIVSFNVKQTQSFDRKFPGLVRGGCYRTELVSLVDSFIRQKEFSHVLEVGGIERPLLKRSERIEYDGLDIEYKDMYKEFYDHFLVQSIEEPIMRTYDMIISVAVPEHVADNTASITLNVQSTYDWWLHRSLHSFKISSVFPDSEVSRPKNSKEIDKDS